MQEMLETVYGLQNRVYFIVVDHDKYK